MTGPAQRAFVPLLTKVKNGPSPGGAGGAVVDCWTVGCACSQAPSSAQLISASAAVGMATAARNSEQSIGRVFMLPPLAEVLEIRPARSRPDARLHLAQIGRAHV